MDDAQLVCNLLPLDSMMTTAAIKRRLVGSRFSALNVVPADFSYTRSAAQTKSR